MSWDRIIGQHRAKELLRSAVSGKRVAHAYLFVGPDGIGKDALALEFARVLTCSSGLPDACGGCPSCQRIETLQHPNIRLVFALPTGKSEKKGDHPIEVLTTDQVKQITEEIQKKAADPYYRIAVPKANFIKINSIRELKREASLTGAEQGTKVLLIFHAEEMNTEAMNSLLKTLEEPLPDTVLLLTTNDQDALLPTVVSRCQVVRCDLLSEDEIAGALVGRDGIAPAEAGLVASVAHGSYSAARDLLSSDIQKQQTEAVEFIRLALGRSRFALMKEVERLAAEYDRPALERWLRFMESWLRDAIVLRERGIRPLMGDGASTQRFVERFPTADLPAAIGRVEASIAHLDKNLYLSLILSNLAIDLRKLITGA